VGTARPGETAEGDERIDRINKMNGMGGKKRRKGESRREKNLQKERKGTKRQQDFHSGGTLDHWISPP